MRKVSVAEQKQIFPEAEVRKIFMKRAEIKKLPKRERNARWNEHRKRINSFMGWLSNIPAIVVK